MMTTSAEIACAHTPTAQGRDPAIRSLGSSGIGTDYADSLRETLAEADRWGPWDAALLRRLETRTERLLLTPAREFEAASSPERVSEEQQRCRDLLRPIWERGPVGREITHWPNGPGSAASMDLIYRNECPRRDLGIHYTEWFLLTRDLAHAVRSRRHLLREQLIQEVNGRRGEVRLLDVACGPCQSLREALPLLCDLGRLHLVGIDTDEHQQLQNAVFFRKSWGVDFSFPVKNALRAPYPPESYDIIYSTGLYDYLKDTSLVRLWNKTFKALKPGGVALLSMKDCGKYCPLFYRWALEWNQFQQRSASHILSLARQAELPSAEVLRDATGIIMLLVVRKAL